MIIITSKGTIQDFFYYLFTVQGTVSKMYAKVARAQLCASHVQQI